MYVPDLEPFRRTPYVELQVGWLDPRHGFETLVPSAELIDALWDFVTNPIRMSRGIHDCELCPRDPDFEARMEAVRRRMDDPSDPLHHVPMKHIPWPVDARTRSTLAGHRGEEVQIGTAQVMAFGDDQVVYSAPSLVFHYVREHHYRPPEPFVRAVLHGPRPPSDEYAALLRLHRIDRIE